MTTFNVTVTFDQVLRLATRRQSVADLRAEDPYGQFEFPDDPREPHDEDDVVVLLLANPRFDAGTVLWMETYSDAMLVGDVHFQAGYVTRCLWDRDAQRYVVLSEWGARV